MLAITDLQDRRRVITPRPATPTSSRPPGPTPHRVQPAPAATQQDRSPIATVSPTRTLTRRAPAARATRETLTHAITRMFNQGYSPKHVEGQIHRWHPGWSPTQIRALVKAAGNPVANTNPTAALPRIAPRVATPTHAAGNTTPQHHHGGGILGALGSALHSTEHGAEWVGHETGRATSWSGHEFDRHASDIAAVSSVAALVAVTLPGGQLLAPALELVAATASADAARQDYRRHAYDLMVLDMLSTASGVGGFAAERNAERLATQGRGPIDALSRIANDQRTTWTAESRAERDAQVALLRSFRSAAARSRAAALAQAEFASLAALWGIAPAASGGGIGLQR